MHKHLLCVAFITATLFAKAQNIFPSSGNVGVGTSSPLKLLHVKGVGAFGNNVTTANATRALNLADGNAVMRILRVHPSYAPAVELISRTTADGPNVAYWDMYAEPSDKSFRIRDRQTGSNLDRLTIDHANGFVGIGTTAPTQPLHVAGNGAFGGDLYVSGDLYKGTIPFLIANNNNTALGLRAGTGYYGNTALGHDALADVGSGAGNTAGGGYALSTSGGYDNTAFGYYAGSYYDVGTLGYSTYLGSYASSIANGYNVTVLGYNAFATANNQVRLGNTSITSVVTASSVYLYSDGRFKRDVQEGVPGLSFINRLRPVTYHYNIRDLNSHLLPKSKGSEANEGSNTNRQEETRRNQKEEESIKAKEQILYSGFVAQEVEQAAKELKYDFSGIYKPSSDKDAYGLSYADFVVPLVKAVQELDQKTKRVEELEKQVSELRQMVLDLKNSRNSALSVANAYLEQASPNPSRGTTIVRYAVPDGASSVRLTLTNAKGQMLNEMSLTAKGTGQVALNTAALPSGVYNYTLWVDGRQADSKQLVVAK